MADLVELLRGAVCSDYNDGQLVDTAADEIESLRARLEIDPAHRVDGIEARDETIRLQNSVIAELRKDAERLNHVERHGCWKVTHDELAQRTDGTNICDTVTVIEGWVAMEWANDDMIKPTLREAIDAAIASEKENERV